MRYIYLKDKKKRKNFLQHEKKRKILAFIIKTDKISYENKTRLSNQLFSFCLKKQFSFVQVKNRCLISYRGRSVYRKYGLARSTLKNLVQTGLIAGLKKTNVN